MAPTLAKWQIEDYVTFNDQQQGLVDKRIASVHEWHRKTQIPDYVAWLESAMQRIEPLARNNTNDAAPNAIKADSLTVEELAKWREQAFGKFEPMFREIATPFAEIVMTLTPAQLDEIQAQIEARNKELREEYFPKDADRAQDERVERWQNRLEFFLGDLTEKQQAWLDRRVRALPSTTGWWEGRLRRQTRMMALLRELTASQPPLDEAVEQVLAVFKDFGEPTNTSEAERRAQVSLQSDQMLADLLSIGPARQYRHLRDLFGDFAADLRSIGDLPSAGSAQAHSARIVARLAARWAPMPL
ncbi:MAG: DUF6279 family lipoprotein [Burkholderiaceae bacterium]